MQAAVKPPTKRRRTGLSCDQDQLLRKRWEQHSAAVGGVHRFAEMSGVGFAKRWLPAKLLLLWTLIHICESSVHLFAPDEVTFERCSNANITISSSSAVSQSVVIRFNVTYSSNGNYSSVITLPQQVLLPVKATSVSFNVSAHHVGQVTTRLLSNNTDLNSLSLRIRFMVVHSNFLFVVSQVIGWIYFLAWSVSFYPQAVENWRRKSVVGLNFDFLALNLTGFIAYSAFNIGLFWIPYIKEEFLERNPNGINPVSANDVFFSLHAVLLCLIYAIQAAAYERGDQKVSWTAIVLLAIGWTFSLVSIFLAVAKTISWLDCLYYFSYIKLAVTLIKYVPQVFMNYRRKTTEGWSIGNVLLDFTGGTLSILQMVLQSYNNDEWSLIFGDPTKFGLGLFSIVFDIIFMAQHYCLYRDPPQYEAVQQEP